MAFVGQNLLMGLFLVLCLSLTLLFSSMFKSSLPAGGIAITAIVAQGLISSIPRFGDFFPGKLLSWGSLLLTGGGQSYWWALVITIAIIVFCVYWAQNRLRHQDF
jgi:ABC-2 type transport system permease protein